MRDDIGFRDDREVMRYYGLCPDCGYPKTLKGCLCDVPPLEPDALPPVDEDHPLRLRGDPEIPF